MRLKSHITIAATGIAAAGPMTQRALPQQTGRGHGCGPIQTLLLRKRGPLARDLRPDDYRLRNLTRAARHSRSNSLASVIGDAPMGKSPRMGFPGLSAAGKRPSAKAPVL